MLHLWQQRHEWLRKWIRVEIKSSIKLQNNCWVLVIFQNLIWKKIVAFSLVSRLSKSQSSLNNHLRSCEDTYFVRKDKYFCLLYEDTFEQRYYLEMIVHLGGV